MLKRGSWAKLQLGPPSRVVNAENEQYDGPDVDAVQEDFALTRTPDQRGHKPWSTHGRDEEGLSKQRKHLQEANKENVRTPVTFPSANESYKSANQSVERRLLLQAKETPSSTYPSYWNPEPEPGNSSRSTLKHLHGNSIANGEERLAPPSFTLPELCQPLGATASQVAINRPREDGRSLQQSPRHGSSTTSAVMNAPRVEPVNKTHTQDDRQPLHAHEHNGASASKRFGSVSKQLECIQKVPMSKPPIDHSATRKSSKCIPNPESVFFSSPEKESDVVVMRSADEEKRFKKIALLGCGGSSKVYKVIGEDYQIYALKAVYMKHVDPAIKKAYVNEVKLLMKLREKPEIITLHDYTWDKQEGVLYLLLEYAEMDLNMVIRKNTWTNPIVTAAYFWNEMLQVVEVIHNEGVIHNDLKPENFVCIGPRLKLIDFGIANRIETEKTSIERDIRCGTINYMAPETIETYEDKDFFKVGKPSDVWSLGCILYRMVYGQTPFEHIRNKLRKWHTITDPTVSISFPDCGNPTVVDVMQQCLVRNPKERPTITELLKHPFSSFCKT